MTPRKRAGRSTRSGRPRHQYPASIGVLAVSGVLLLSLGLPAIRDRMQTGPGTTDSPLEVLCAFDVSGSQSPQQRQRLCGLMDQVVEAALPAGARVRVWTFARTAEPVYDGTPRQARDLWRLQDEVLKAPPRRARGTRPAAALREIARAAQEADRQGRSSAAILFWDGGDDDPTETARLAGQLARCRGLRAVWVAGIPARSGLTLRAGVERTFRPLQERLLVSGPYDAAAGLDSLRAKAGGN